MWTQPPRLCTQRPARDAAPICPYCVPPWLPLLSRDAGSCDAFGDPPPWIEDKNLKKAWPTVIGVVGDPAGEIDEAGAHQAAAAACTQQRFGLFRRLLGKQGSSKCPQDVKRGQHHAFFQPPARMVWRSWEELMAEHFEQNTIFLCWSTYAQLYKPGTSHHTQKIKREVALSLV